MTYPRQHQLVGLMLGALLLAPAFSSAQGLAPPQGDVKLPTDGPQLDRVGSNWMLLGLGGGSLESSALSSSRVGAAEILYAVPVDSLIYGFQFVFGASLAGHGGVQSATVPLSLRYTFDLGRNFMPHLGLGLGYFVHREKDVGKGVIDHGFQFFQGRAGVTWFTSETWGIDFGVGYSGASYSLRESATRLEPSRAAFIVSLVFLP